MTVTLSFWCLCDICCGHGRLGVTASGDRPVPYVTIAAPRSVPLGTVVYVTSRKLGWRRHRCVVQDRTARRHEPRWDLFVTSHEEAKRLGLERVRVEFE